jgi:hypothetical protein
MAEMSFARDSRSWLRMFPLLVAVPVLFLGCGNRGQRSEGPRQHQAGVSLNQAPAGQPPGERGAKQGGAVPDPVSSPKLSRDPVADTSEVLSDPAFPFGKPEAGAPPPRAAPFDTMHAVALVKARAWLKCVAEGPAIPYLDFEGKTIAVMFHFRVDGESFPTEYRTAMKDATAPSVPGRSGYAHVLVSASYDYAPVVTFGPGLSEYYVACEARRRYVMERFSASNPILRRIYTGSAWPGMDVWFDFKFDGREVVIGAFQSAPMDAKTFLRRMRQDVRAVRKHVPDEAETSANDTSAVGQHPTRGSREEWARSLDSRKR